MKSQKTEAFSKIQHELTISCGVPSVVNADCQYCDDDINIDWLSAMNGEFHVDLVNHEFTAWVRYYVEEQYYGLAWKAVVEQDWARAYTSDGNVITKGIYIGRTAF